MWRCEVKEEWRGEEGRVGCAMRGESHQGRGVPEASASGFQECRLVVTSEREVYKSDEKRSRWLRREGPSGREDSRKFSCEDGEKRDCWG